MADYVLTVPRDTSLELTLNNGGSQQCDPVPVSSLSGLPAGDYDRQPLAWDAGTEAWIPASGFIRINTYASEEGSGVTLQGEGGALVSTVGGVAEINSAVGASRAGLQCESLGGPGGSVNVSITGSDDVPRLPFQARVTGIVSELGFFEEEPIAQPEVTGSVGGNAALASLVAQLAALGLIIDSTTA